MQAGRFLETSTALVVQEFATDVFGQGSEEVWVVFFGLVSLLC
jgi:hypothetical protein